MTATRATAAARRELTPAAAVLTLTLLLGIQPVTTDLYLPALPLLAQDLAASMSAVQLTLSALIICFGLAQLLWGPLADRYGRRPVLLAGLALYTVAGAGAALSPAIGWLILWRALQGVGMAAAVTCGRSIVRDLYEPHEGARVMSRALGGLGMIAMASPLLGGLAVQWFSWHAALGLVTLFGLGALAFIAWRFDETVPVKDRSATRSRQIARNWRAIIGHPGFRAWTALLCCTWGGLFVMLAASSFVYIEVLGTSRLAYGGVLASISMVYVCGTILCRRLLRTRKPRDAVRLGAAFSLGGGVLIAALSLAGVHTVWALLVPQWIYALGHGIHQPCGQAGAVSAFPSKAGTAASLSGFAMMLTAFASGIVLGKTMNGTVYPLSLGVAVFGVGVAITAWTLVRRHGECSEEVLPVAQAA